MCEKAIWVMESSVAIFIVLYLKSPLLLTFNILPLFFYNPVYNTILNLKFIVAINHYFLAVNFKNRIINT